MLKFVIRTPGLTALAALAAVGASAVGARADFNYANFTGATGINLVGAAQKSGSSIFVTPSVNASAGAMWIQQKQNVSTGFDTTLTMHIQDRQGGGSDGFALVLQNSSAMALGGPGGAMGYARNLVFGQSGISNSLAIAFDMWQNSIFDWTEAGDNHVSIQSRGLLENYPDLASSLGNAPTADLSDSSTHTMRVNYAGGLLSVYLDGSLTPTLQTAVNLSTLLALDNTPGAGELWVGITAGTGAAQDRQGHSIDSWQWSSNPVPTPGSAGLLGLGLIVAARRRR